MQSTLFTDITDSKQRIARISDEGNRKSKDHTIDPSQLAKENYKYDATYCVWMGEVQKVEAGTLLKSSFMMYEIKTVRQADEETVSVWKRYKDLYKWYTNLIYELEPIEYNPNIKFPMYSESWLSGEKSGEVDSDFVQRRRIDLQNFFQRLFAEYPNMYEHPMVQDLLQLHRFAPLARGSNIYSKPESYYDVYNGTAKKTDLAEFSEATPTSFQPANATTDAYQRIAPRMATNNFQGISIASFITDGSGNSTTIYNNQANKQKDRQNYSSEYDEFKRKGNKVSSSMPSSVFTSSNSSNSGNNNTVNEWAV